MRTKKDQGTVKWRNVRKKYKNLFEGLIAYFL
jgi:hypothetical protein